MFVANSARQYYTCRQNEAGWTVFGVFAGYTLCGVVVIERAPAAATAVLLRRSAGNVSVFTMEDKQVSADEVDVQEIEKKVIDIISG